mmetsp:Transcript_42141/g.123327  ORF Transcript_42141/g.123327 Transcript_42141/m.123327 type:complete len:255 (+) Transcript_42141:886-1650(+)
MHGVPAADGCGAEVLGNRLGRHRAKGVLVDHRCVVRFRRVLHQELPVAADQVLLAADRHEVGERPTGQADVDVAHHVLEWRRGVGARHKEESRLLREPHPLQRPLRLAEARRHLLGVRKAAECTACGIEGPSVWMAGSRVSAHGQTLACWAGTRMQGSRLDEIQSQALTIWADDAAREATRLLTRQCRSAMRADICPGADLVVLAPHNERARSAGKIDTDEASWLVDLFFAARQHPRRPKEVLHLLIVPPLAMK